MSFKDLREFISALQERHDIKSIEGAVPELEIGAVTQLAAESAQCPALLFDSIPGFDKGQRVLTNALASESRERMMFGLSQELSDKDALAVWKDRLKNYRPVAPANAGQAPVKQNILADGAIDLAKLPWLRWFDNDPEACQHGTLVVTKDPRSGQIGLAAHSFAWSDRATIVARATTSAIDPIWQAYWSSGQPCPVAISLGQDPSLLAAALCGVGMPEPPGYGFAGWFRGAAVEVIGGELTGLPIPATAEIVLEGEVNPPGQDQSGAPKVTIHRLYFRNDPIMLAGAPFLPSTYGVLASSTAALWIELEERGVAGIHGINQRPWGVTVVSIKQLDAAHVQRVSRALIESSASRNLRYAIVVDDDIDPFNLEKVFWAIATRYEPQEALDIIRPTKQQEAQASGAQEGGSTTSHSGAAAIIDACRPYRWIDKFPRTTDISEALMKQTIQKWGKVLERNN